MLPKPPCLLGTHFKVLLGPHEDETYVFGLFRNVSQSPDLLWARKEFSRAFGGVFWAWGVL